MEKFLVKYAAMINGTFVAFVIITHHMAFTDSKPADAASLLWGAGFWCVWACILYAFPRWLMRIKWALYLPALILLAVFIAEVS